MEDEKVMTAQEAIDGMRTVLAEFAVTLNNIESDLPYEGEEGGAMSVFDALKDLASIVGEKYDFGGGHGYIYEMWKAMRD